ncbi:hypothetical protein, partial [Massilia niastensis]|uniref:hypothetical protein n=1 Tax=Massilia niastensis TaxID=544911 RepID=UPI001B7F8A56
NRLATPCWGKNTRFAARQASVDSTAPATRKISIKSALPYVDAEVFHGENVGGSGSARSEETVAFRI